MQEAIQNGKEGSVVALLQGMIVYQQEEQLRATYGGSENSPDSPDSSNLYAKTSPMLHAARCGNSEAFSTLLRSTRELLNPWEVGWVLVLRSEHPDL